MHYKIPSTVLYTMAQVPIESPLAIAVSFILLFSNETITRLNYFPYWPFKFIREDGGRLRGANEAALVFYLLNKYGYRRPDILRLNS